MKNNWQAIGFLFPIFLLILCVGFSGNDLKYPNGVSVRSVVKSLTFRILLYNHKFQYHAKTKTN